LCENCNKKGHPKCTYASRLRNINYNEEEGELPEHAEDYQFESDPANTNCDANTISEANGAAQNMVINQENIESSSIEGDLNESNSGESVADKSISASQLNTISDIQRTVSNENSSMVVLGNPDRFKRGADTSLSSLTSTSPSKDDAKMDEGAENGNETSSSELKASEEGKSNKTKKKKTNKQS
jgi:hypothetical protein